MDTTLYQRKLTVAYRTWLCRLANLAVSLAKKVNVIGFDINTAKIELYKSGVDPTKEIGNDAVKNTAVNFTTDETRLHEVMFHIVVVPTPVHDDHTLDHTPLKVRAEYSGATLPRALWWFLNPRYA